MQLYSQYVWTSSIIDSVISVFQRPKYKFNVQFREFTPAEYQRRDCVEGYKFKFKTKLGIYEIIFDMHENFTYVLIHLLDHKYTGKLNPPSYAFFQRRFVKGDMKKIRRWAVMCVNTINAEIYRISCLEKSQYVLHQ